MKEQYYKIITDIWKQFRDDLITVESITDPQDKRWTEIVEHYERIEQETPVALRDYAGSMIRLHVFELENIWRFK